MLFLLDTRNEVRNLAGNLSATADELSSFEGAPLFSLCNLQIRTLFISYITMATAVDEDGVTLKKAKFSGDTEGEQTTVVEETVTEVHTTTTATSNSLFPTFGLHAPSKLLCASEESNKLFLYKGIKWSPDGTCLLTNTEDNFLRLYEM